MWAYLCSPLHNMWPTNQLHLGPRRQGTFNLCKRGPSNETLETCLGLRFSSGYYNPGLGAEGMLPLAVWGWIWVVHLL